MRGIRTHLGRTQCRLKEVTNQIIIIGANDIGIHLAETLGSQNQNVVLIDEREEFLQELHEEIDVLALPGNPLVRETLKVAGAGEGARLVAVTESDEVNMLLMYLAGSTGVQEGYALIRSQEQYESFLPVVGHLPGQFHLIDLPELVTGRVEQRGLLQVRTIHTDLERGVRIIAIEFRVKHPFVGESIGQLKLTGRNKPLFVLKHGKVLPARPDFRIEAQDVLVLQIELIEQERVLRNWFPYESGQKVLLGGSYILPSLLRHWPGFSRGLTCIDKSLQNCQQMLKIGGHALVLKGDGLDIALLQEARIEEAQIYLAASDNDEVNLLASLLAKSFGVKDVLTLLQKRQHTGMLERLSLDGIISIPQLVVEHLLARLTPSKKDSQLSKLEVRWMREKLPESAQLILRGGTYLSAQEQRLHDGEEVLTIL